MSGDYDFTYDWFGERAQLWDQLMPQFPPSRILEIGSFEGRSTVYLIEEISQHRPLEIHCVDSFEGGSENHSGPFAADMSAVEARFAHNTKVALSKAANAVDLQVHKGSSDVELARLLADGKQNYFDFVYVDGSHQAPDVLLDALLSFKLTRVGGLIGFDDYTWQDPAALSDVLRAPKLAIDIFTNVYRNKIQLIQFPIFQVYVQKVSA